MKLRIGDLVTYTDLESPISKGRGLVTALDGSSYMSNVEIPSRDGAGLHDGKVAGIWHEEWNQSRQGQWIEQFYKIALSKPFVSSVTYSSLADTKGSTMTNSGLLTDQLEPKKSFRTLKKLNDAIFSR